MNIDWKKIIDGLIETDDTLTEEVKNDFKACATLHRYFMKGVSLAERFNDLGVKVMRK